MKAWVSGQVAAEIAHEAGEHEPLEAGGMLLGYWSGDDVVVTSCIASGPRTKRGTTWLVPDQEWQMARLGEVYEASGRLTTYLGLAYPPRWCALSKLRDRRTLRAVRRSKDARTPRPLMMIVGPRAEDAPFLWCLTGGLKPIAVVLEVFEPRVQ